MVYFEFRNKETGELVPFQQIDDELRKELDLPPDSDNYCDEFDLLTLFGITAYYHGEYKPPPLPETVSEYQRRMRQIYIDFVHLRYTFHCFC